MQEILRNVIFFISHHILKCRLYTSLLVPLCPARLAMLTTWPAFFSIMAGRKACRQNGTSVWKRLDMVISTYMATPSFFCLLLHTLILDPPKSLFLMQVALTRNCVGMKNHVLTLVLWIRKYFLRIRSGRPIYYRSGRIGVLPEQF